MIDKLGIASAKVSGWCDYCKKKWTLKKIEFSSETRWSDYVIHILIHDMYASVTLSMHLMLVAAFDVVQSKYHMSVGSPLWPSDIIYYIVTDMSELSLMTSSHYLNWPWLVISQTVTNTFQQIFNQNLYFFIKKMQLKMLSSNYQPFWSCLSVLTGNA